MKERSSTIITLVVLLAIAGGVGLFYSNQATPPSASTEASSVLDRVEKTGEIRCGYWIYEPYISKDPNTGKMSGLTVDYLEQTAARMGKKIKWEAEVGFDQVLPSLTYGRIDTFCVPCSPAKDFAKVFDFVGSFGQLPYYLYVAKGHAITKEQLQTARFVAVDGYLTIFKTMEYFPKATLLTLPQVSSPADVYNQIKYGKVDASLNENVSAINYMRSNENALRRLENTPVFTVSMSFPIKKGDVRWGAFMQHMTDTTIPENKALFLSLLAKYNLTEESLKP